MVTKRNADAVQCYDELAKLTTLDAAAETYYSIALMREGDADRVISILSPLVQAPYPTVLMYNTLGYAYYMKKRAIRKRPTPLSRRSSSTRTIQTFGTILRSCSRPKTTVPELAQYNLIKRTATPLADQLYRDLNRDKIIYVNEAASKK